MSHRALSSISSFECFYLYWFSRCHSTSDGVLKSTQTASSSSTLPTLLRKSCVFTFAMTYNFEDFGFEKGWKAIEASKDVVTLSIHVHPVFSTQSRNLFKRNSALFMCAGKICIISDSNVTLPCLGCLSSKRASERARSSLKFNQIYCSSWSRSDRPSIDSIILINIGNALQLPPPHRREDSSFMH